MGDLRIGGNEGEIPFPEEEPERYPGGLGENTQNYYRAACRDCPWVSPYYPVKAQAVEAGEAHIREQEGHRYRIQVKTVSTGSRT